MAWSTCVIRGIPIPKSTTRRPRQTTRLLLPVDFQKIGDFRITVKENSVLSIFYSVAAVSSSLRAVFSARANIQSFLLFIKSLGKKKKALYAIVLNCQILAIFDSWRQSCHFSVMRFRLRPIASLLFRQRAGSLGVLSKALSRSVSSGLEGLREIHRAGAIVDYQ